MGKLWDVRNRTMKSNFHWNNRKHAERLKIQDFVKSLPDTKKEDIQSIINIKQYLNQK